MSGVLTLERRQGLRSGHDRNTRDRGAVSTGAGDLRQDRRNGRADGSERRRCREPESRHRIRRVKGAKAGQAEGYLHAARSPAGNRPDARDGLPASIRRQAVRLGYQDRGEGI